VPLRLTVGFRRLFHSARKGVTARKRSVLPCEDYFRTVLFITTDIDEAILLADRLVILANIPARVRAEIDADLSRPRRPAQIYEDDRANDTKLAALRILHDEALKSFHQGSKAAADFLDAYAKRVTQSASGQRRALWTVGKFATLFICLV
jgi:ABC-type proline/glycine betaine transport system ATPase subunit